MDAGATRFDGTTSDRRHDVGSENPGPAEGEQGGLAGGSQNPGPGTGAPHVDAGSENPGPDEGGAHAPTGGSQNPGPAHAESEAPEAGHEAEPAPLPGEHHPTPRAGGEAVAHPREADLPREPDRPAGA